MRCNGLVTIVMSTPDSISEVIDGDAIAEALSATTKLNMNMKRISACGTATCCSPEVMLWEWLSRSKPQALRPTIVTVIAANAASSRRRTASRTVSPAIASVRRISVRAARGSAPRGSGAPGRRPRPARRARRAPRRDRQPRRARSPRRRATRRRGAMSPKRPIALHHPSVRPVTFTRTRVWRPSSSPSVPVASARPLSITATRSQTCSASSSRWVLRNTVAPRSRSPRTIVLTSWRPTGSSALVGSSSMISAGSPSSATPSPRRCCIPFENVPTRSSPRSASPTVSSAASICPAHDDLGSSSRRQWRRSTSRPLRSAWKRNNSGR